MDFLTHILIGYLLGADLFGSGPLVAWTAIAAYAPDLDVFLWHFSKRWPALRHRGITHSIPAGIVTVGLGTLVMWLGFGVSPLLAFAAGAIGWTSHVVLDVLNWGCLLLYPWRKDMVEFTVQDHLTKPALVSLASLAGLSWIATHEAPIVLRMTELAMTVAWAGYFAWRLANKIYLSRRHGPDAHILPTSRVFTWRVAIAKHGDAVQSALLEHRVLRRVPVRVLHESRFEATRPTGPLETPAKAAAYTHHLPEVAELSAQGSPLHYRAERHGDGWVVRWYALDSVYGPACAGAEVTVHGDGEVEVRRCVMPLPVTQADGAARGWRDGIQA